MSSVARLDNSEHCHPLVQFNERITDTPWPDSISERSRIFQRMLPMFSCFFASRSYEYRKEMERLGIDLSWKSSQIEGNTYSLLETERLLRESKTANGKTKEEAVMLLNHKDALRFILDNPDYLQKLSVSHIEDIHQLLTKELSVDKGIRHRRVGITGTNYHPLDNEFQIREALYDTCDLINGKENIFEKALLTLVLLSYIQAFTEGIEGTGTFIRGLGGTSSSAAPAAHRRHRARRHT